MHQHVPRIEMYKIYNFPSCSSLVTSAPSSAEAAAEGLERVLSPAPSSTEAEAVSIEAAAASLPGPPSRSESDLDEASSSASASDYEVIDFTDVM